MAIVAVEGPGRCGQNQYLTCRFFSLNEMGLVSPSSSTAARPDLTFEVCSITIPDRLLYFEDAGDVRRMVVTAVPGGGFGMRLCSCIVLRFPMASASPCFDANWTHLHASA